MKDAHGMVLLDDFTAVQQIVNESTEFAEVLKNTASPTRKVITTPLTVGYFDGKDGLKQEDRLLKVVSYLDVGDGNYWAHPIENRWPWSILSRKIQKIEEGAVVPVLMTPRPYDGRDRIETPKNRSTSLSRKARTTPLPAIWCTGRTGIST